jgi:hypothetical protein
MDGWTEGETDIQMNEQKERDVGGMKTKRQTERKMDRPMDEWTDIETD